MVKICSKCNMKNSNKSDYCVNCSSSLSSAKIIEDKVFDSKIDAYSKEEHTTNGKIALFCGILGIIIVFFINYIPFFLAIMAIGWGILARRQGDRYGTYGLILGILTFILTIVVAALTYLYVSSLLSGIH